MKRCIQFLSIYFLTGLSLAIAAGLSDPFNTEINLSLRPAATLSSRAGSLPCADALPSTPLSAVDVLDLAICNNPQTRELWANARAQAALVGVSHSAWMPSLNSKAALNRIKSDDRYETQKTASLTVSWLAFDFGARQAALTNAEQLLLASLATQQASIQSLFLAALQAYYTAQASKAAVESARQAEVAAKTSFNAAETRYRVGTGTPADRLQAQTAFSQSTLNRIRAEGEARNALGSLANIMGFAPQQAIVLQESAPLLPDASFQRDIDQLMQDARKQRPDLLAAESQVRAAQANIDLAKAQGRPTVTLTSGPAWQEMAGVSSNSGSLGVAVNVPMACKIGSVGQFLPGIECEFEAVPGIENGGALHVKGPNVMKGYYLFDQPGVIQPPQSIGAGWYSTGDIVARDEDGYVHIRGRLKRFAKIAGEMVSLEVVEKIATTAAPGFIHAASTRSDAAKGEALVLFSTAPGLTREQLSAAAKTIGAPELAVPRIILQVEAVPLLGSGKTDYVKLKQMAKAA
mgnify:CR=1 FL=1